jgi:hypothetical protein
MTPRRNTSSIRSDFFAFSRFTFHAPRFTFHVSRPTFFTPLPIIPMSISLLLDQTFALQRQQVASDASGGATRTFATLLAQVPCATEPASAAISADYARRDMLVDSHVYTTANLDALVSGGVQLGDRFATGSAYFLVKAVCKFANAAVSGEVLYRVDCERRVT